MGVGVIREPNAVSCHNGALCLDWATPQAACAGRPGIRRWPREYLPGIFDEKRVDRVMEISQREAEETMRSLARVEGAPRPSPLRPSASTCFRLMHV